MYKSQLRTSGHELHLKRGLRAHAISYVAVNLLSVVLWWLLTPDLFFWPLYSLVGWGIGLAFHVWAVRRHDHSPQG